MTPLTQALTLSPTILDELIAHARSCSPIEACGLLAGRETHAARFIPMENRLASPTAYEMDAGQLIQIFRSLRERGEQLLAICHSHPSTSAEPSRGDIESAYYPEAAHLIVSLANPGQPQVRAFRIGDGEAVEIELHVIV
jgi:proteasome lid subunit RPN8/RPN11